MTGARVRPDVHPTDGGAQESNGVRDGARPRRRKPDARGPARRRPGSLPMPGTSLVGRARDVDYIEACLTMDGKGAIRHLTLVGSPGTGKTRLAIAAAERLSESYEHGVYFIDLSGHRESASVPATIAHTIGATHAGRRQSAVVETLKRALRDRQVLLVLDNFEGVLQAGRAIDELLSACPQVRALVTSREPLRTKTERQYEVAPLGTPNLSALPSLDLLRQIEAVELFVERVQIVRPGWQLTAANAGAVAEICVRLDGLPLAIELAASWMNVLTPQTMLAEPPETVYSLGIRGADLGVRHQTLEATIGWSFELLAGAEKQLFRRLAVFVNGWTVDACVGVCDDEGTERAEILGILGSLVDKHLVTRTEDDDGTVRFGFLETIRGFASRRLLDRGELESMQRRHAAFFVALGEKAELEIEGSGQTLWIEYLERERGNIRAALDWAQTTRGPDASDLGLRLAATLWLFWDVRGHLQEGREPLRELLQAPEAQLQNLPRARALLAAAWLGYVKGDVEEVDRVVAESASIARDCGDVRVEARGLAILGTTLAAYSNDMHRTNEVLYQALDLSLPVGELWSTGFAYYSLGALAMKAGRLQEASEYLERCREVTAANGNTFGIGCALFRLGWLAGANGEHARAVSLLKQALELHWALRNRRVVALILEQVACLQVGSSDAWDRARMFAAAETMFEQLPDYTPAPQIVDAHERGVRAARERLGGEAFREAWTAGRSMSVERAVSVALEGEGAPWDNLIQSGLSAREVQVLRLVAAGLTNRQIGLRLGLSYHTIDHHLRRIFGKVGFLLERDWRCGQ